MIGYDASLDNFTAKELTQLYGGIYEPPTQSYGVENLKKQNMKETLSLTIRKEN